VLPGIVETGVLDETDLDRLAERADMHPRAVRRPARPSRMSCFNAFEVHDVREEQQARVALFNYLASLCEDLKRAGEQAGASQQYASLVAFRNLAGGLVDNAYADSET